MARIHSNLRPAITVRSSVVANQLAEVSHIIVLIKNQRNARAGATKQEKYHLSCPNYNYYVTNTRIISRKGVNK